MKNHEHHEIEVETVQSFIGHVSTIAIETVADVTAVDDAVLRYCATRFPQNREFLTGMKNALSLQYEDTECFLLQKPILAARIIKSHPFYTDRKDLWFAGHYSQREYNQWKEHKETMEAKAAMEAALKAKLAKLQARLQPLLQVLGGEPSAAMSRIAVEVIPAHGKRPEVEIFHLVLQNPEQVEAVENVFTDQVGVFLQRGETRYKAGQFLVDFFLCDEASEPAQFSE